MNSERELNAEEAVMENGKIVFATDVISTIAALAAAEVDGVVGMSSGVVDGIAQLLGRKNLTKGIKVEVGTEEAAIDISIIVQYGFKIHEVCRQVQIAIKNAIETMTGLKVIEINVSVVSVNFEKPEKPEKMEKPQKEKPEPIPEAPSRVR